MVGWAVRLGHMLRPLHFENKGDVDEEDYDEEEKMMNQLTCTCRQPSLQASHRSAGLKAAIIKNQPQSRVWIQRQNSFLTQLN